VINNSPEKMKMPIYTHFRYISYPVSVALYQVMLNDIYSKKLGDFRPHSVEDDIDCRLSLVRALVEQTWSLANTEPKYTPYSGRTLKIYVLPEFFFRGADKLPFYQYQRDDDSYQRLRTLFYVKVKSLLEELLKAKLKLNDVLFILGTIPFGRRYEERTTHSSEEKKDFYLREYPLRQKDKLAKDIEWQVDNTPMFASIIDKKVRIGFGLPKLTTAHDDYPFINHSHLLFPSTKVISAQESRIIRANAANKVFQDHKSVCADGDLFKKLSERSRTLTLKRDSLLYKTVPIQATPPSFTDIEVSFKSPEHLSEPGKVSFLTLVDDVLVPQKTNVASEKKFVPLLLRVEVCLDFLNSSSTPFFERVGDAYLKDAQVLMIVTSAGSSIEDATGEYKSIESTVPGTSRSSPSKLAASHTSTGQLLLHCDGGGKGQGIWYLKYHDTPGTSSSMPQKKWKVFPAHHTRVTVSCQNPLLPSCFLTAETIRKLDGPHLPPLENWNTIPVESSAKLEDMTLLKTAIIYDRMSFTMAE